MKAILQLSETEIKRIIRDHLLNQAVDVESEADIELLVSQGQRDDYHVSACARVNVGHAP